MPIAHQLLPQAQEPALPAVSNARLGLLVFLAAETMLFAGLIGGYMVLRYGTTTWPPPGQPYLPIAITWANTFVLLASAVTIQIAVRSTRRGKRASALGLLLATTALGILFLAIQGNEWIQLLGHGLTVVDGTYGASFLFLIGLHAVHVLAAVLWLIGLAVYVLRQRFLAACLQAVDLGRIYWFFVAALWLVLFKVVYLG